MKLLYSPTSPYVRKCMVVAHETGLVSRIETVPVAVLPVKPNDEVASHNPLIKVPTLVLDDGTNLFDSPVIAEYLDSLHGGRKLFPAAGPARWAALRRQAAADGGLDAGLLSRYELTLRPAEFRWSDWVDGQLLKIRNTLAAFEAEAKSLAAEPTIGEISIGCLLGYVDFRFADMAWRSHHPALAAWYAGFGERPSMVATRPPAA
ncbi:MAG TPA: glutathione S-transferase [Stellaceae bacterium]|nr:glutathione S-transferase [Stellaceae bacterium]